MSANKEAEQKKLLVSPAPHLFAKRTTQDIMFLVCAALLLPTAAGVYYFGVYTLFVVLVSVVTAVLTEYVSKYLRKREFVMDGSAVVTGMLLALVMPPRVPLWMVVIGAAFAIAIVKEAFGGLGYNIFNPALAARAFLSVTFAGTMTKWISPVADIAKIDSSTTATPLSEKFIQTGSDSELYMDLLFGDVGGSIGETSALLILIGGLILLFSGVIKWRIPTVYIGTVFLLTWIIPGEDPIFHILAGGLFLGAFFMATDYVTAPLTDKGQFIFAAGAGILVVLIRLYASMPEGVAFSILLMNAMTPLIDRYVRPTPYGYVPPEKPEEEAKDADAPKDKPAEKKEEKPKEGAEIKDDAAKDEKAKEEAEAKDDAGKDIPNKNEAGTNNDDTTPETNDTPGEGGVEAAGPPDGTGEALDKTKDEPNDKERS